MKILANGGLTASADMLRTRLEADPGCSDVSDESFLRAITKGLVLPVQGLTCIACMHEIQNLAHAYLHLLDNIATCTNCGQTNL